MGNMPAEDEYPISSSSTTENFVLPTNTPQSKCWHCRQSKGSTLNDQIDEKLEKKMKKRLSKGGWAHE